MLVQPELNNRVQPRLGYRTPITVFKGLRHHANIDVIKTSTEYEILLKEVGDVVIKEKKMIEKLSVAMGQIHRDAAEGARKELHRMSS